MSEPHDDGRSQQQGPADQAPWLRLDPRSILTGPVKVARQALVPLVAATVGIGTSNGPVGMVLLVPAAVVVALLTGLVPWLTTTYRVTGSRLEVRRGLLNRSTLTARLERVRSVDLEMNLLHRLLRLARVTVGTGVDESRIELDSLGVADAERLRGVLLHGLRTQPDPSTTPEVVGAPAPGSLDTTRPVAADSPASEPSGTELARLHWSWLRFAPLNVGELLLAVAGLGAVGQFFDVFSIDEGEARSVWEHAADVGAVTLVAAGVPLLVLAWVVLSVAGYAVRWGGLTITREGDAPTSTLRRVHGLLTQRATTVEEAKVRGAVLRTPLLVGAAGGARLDLLTTGLDDNEPAVLPSAPRAVALVLSADVLGETDAMQGDLVAHGAVSRRRHWWRGVRAAALWAAVAAVLVWGLDRIWDAAHRLPDTVPSVGLAVAMVVVVVMVVMLPVCVAVAELRYRRLGHALTQRYLISRDGTFGVERTALEADGIIGWRLRQGFWDRRRGLAQLTALTAAGPESVTVRDVPLDVAVALAAAATPRVLADFLTGPHA